MVLVAQSGCRQQAVEQHVVRGEGVGFAFLQHGERFGVVIADQKLDAEMLFVRDRPHRGLVGRAGGHDDRLVAQIAVGAYARGARHQKLGAGDEEDRREGDLLLALEVGCRRAAFEIDLA